MGITKRWNTSKHAVYNIGYHLIWYPKYRKRVLVGEVEHRLKHLLLEKASEWGWVVEFIDHHDNTTT